jgi:hypothetical protein
VSVDHPDVVENYRVAHGIHERARQHQASTEDLREALLRYRSLFEELLRPGDQAAAPDGSAVPRPARSADDRPVTDRPVTDSPVTDRPLTDRPAGDRPLGNGPASDRPARGQQATDVEARDDSH